MAHSTIDYLIRCAKAAPSADNTQPWVFQKIEDGVVLRYATERAATATFGRDDPAILLAIGAVLENFRQAAKVAGCQIVIDRWPKSLPDGTYASIKVAAHAESVPDSTPDLLLRHTNRWPFERHRPVPSDIVGRLSDNEGLARTVWLKKEEGVVAAELTRQASAVRFQTQEVHEWLAKSLRFTPEDVARGDGLDVRTLALPPGGAALLRFLSPWPRMRALNRMGMYRLMAAIEAAPIKAAPSLFAIVAPSGKDELLDAGMLMERVWVELNTAGLAVQPYYVIPDQLNRLAQGEVPSGLEESVREVGDRCRKLLNLPGGEQLQMLFRVGYPTRDPERSRRLPDAELTEP